MQESPSTSAPGEYAARQAVDDLLQPPPVLSASARPGGPDVLHDGL